MHAKNCWNIPKINSQLIREEHKKKYSGNSQERRFIISAVKFTSYNEFLYKKMFLWHSADFDKI